MKRIEFLAVVLLALVPACAAVGGVGFQRTTVPDSDQKPREVGIWYPTDAASSLQTLGPYRHHVAPDGAVAGSRLPLILMLHGVQGSFANHYHTALALADAGFVVAAITQGDDIRLVERPRHLARVLDYMLAAWVDRDRLDPQRVGLFGFSVGGFATLVAIGGVPELGRIPGYCNEYPDRVCSMLKERNVDTSVAASAWTHDARIKAAVVAAPTLAFTFDRKSLAVVQAPVLLWRAALDQITPHPRAAEAIHLALPPRHDYVVVPDAGHFAFVACGAEMEKRAPAICQDAPGFDRPAFHREFNAAVVDFFRGKLPLP
jgi:predicted dienelactone hydrolase